MSTYLTLFMAMYILSISAAMYTTNPIHPTIINETGEYYLVYNTSNYDFSNQSIVCNYYNRSIGSNPRNCYITCDKLQGCTHSTINCDNAPICSIGCNNNKSCATSTISASNTSSFELACDEESSCLSANVYYNNSNLVNIICNGNNSCMDININGNYSSYLSIECIYNNSCISPIIGTSNIVNTSLFCYGPKYNYLIPYQACNGIIWNSMKSSMFNVTSAYIMKRSNLTIRSVDYVLIDTIAPSALSSNNFDIYDAKKVFISCLQDGSCYRNEFNVYNNANITWYCGYKDSKTKYNYNGPCRSSILNAPNANYINMAMNGWTNSPLYITGPSYTTDNQTGEIIPKSNIKCIFGGCDQIFFTSKNGLIDWNIYFSFPGDNACDDINACSSFGSSDLMESCIFQWQFNCGILRNQIGQYYPYSSLKYTGQCGNNQTFDAIKSQFNSAYNDASDGCWWNWDWDVTGWEVAGMIAMCVCFCCGGLFMCWWCSFRKKRKYAKYPTLI